MPVSQMRNGLTAENSIFSQKPNVKVSRSKFDLSRLNCFTSDIGMIVPVDIIPTLPNDDFDLSCQYKIDFRPLLVPTLTSYKVKVHYYYAPLSYLWEGFESFISKGRNGRLNLEVPSISNPSGKLEDYVCKGITDTSLDFSDSSLSIVSNGYKPFCPHSLYDYLIGSVPYSNGAVANQYLPFAPTTGNTATGYNMLNKINALPFLMYQKIYRSNYLDPNLMSNGTVESKVWFPDDIDSSSWRFNYAGSNTYDTMYFSPIGESIATSTNLRANFVPVPSIVGASNDVGDNAVNLTQLRYAMYSDDMFTTALPFLQRGPQTSLDLDVTGISLESSFVGSSQPVNVNFTPSGSLSNTIPTHVLNGRSVMFKQPVGGTGSYWVTDEGSVNREITSSFSGQPVSLSIPYTPKGTVSSKLSGAGSVQFTAQALRSLLALSVWQERNALTNGSYGQFIKVHFNSSPNNSWFEPIYIGGCTSVFNVNSILQTSTPSTATNGNTPLGSPAGVGGSGNSTKLGHFRASDYGYILAVMMIIPDNVYSTTHDHWEFDLNQNDYFMPEFEQLSYQPILNKQLFASGNNDTDNGLFGYSNRYVYLKQRDSIARGMFALPASIDSYYHSYVQSRNFTNTPKLSQNFVTVYPPNIDRSFLAYTGQPAFLVQYYSSVSAVRPLSYLSQPNTFGF